MNARNELREATGMHHGCGLGYNAVAENTWLPQLGRRDNRIVVMDNALGPRGRARGIDDVGGLARIDVLRLKRRPFSEQGLIGKGALRSVAPIEEKDSLHGIWSLAHRHRHEL